MEWDDLEQKALVAAAAKLAGRKPTTFIREVAVRHAKRVLADPEMIALLLGEPPPKENLRKSGDEVDDVLDDLVARLEARVRARREQKD